MLVIFLCVGLSSILFTLTLWHLNIYDGRDKVLYLFIDVLLNIAFLMAVAYTLHRLIDFVKS